MDFDNFAKRVDAKFNLPRPINEQHLSSYRALLRFSQDCGRSAMYFVCAFLGTACLIYASNLLELTIFSLAGAFFLFFTLMLFVAAAADSFQLKLHYQRIFQRETFGAGRWATVSSLKSLKMVTPNTQNPLPDAVALATFGHKHMLTLPIHIMAEHLAFFGPPGSGKSASFFINLARSFSFVGGAIMLDIKGEIYRYASHYYPNTYRFDLQKPEFSDRFDVFGGCKNDGKRAGQVASWMTGYDPNSQASGGENSFFIKAATAMLKCLILHLTQIMEHPTPADIFEFINDNPFDGKVNLLAEAMSNSADADVPGEWGASFAQTDPKTIGNVTITLTTALAAFRDPAVRDALRMPNEHERKRGCRVIDFFDLRKKGTGIFVVVPEGDASRLEAVVATIFACATDTLRKTGDDTNGTYSLVMLDEAGNVPLRNLSEGVGVGRGRKIIYALGYQSKTMLEKQYGRATAESILGSIGAKFFLPALTAETAEYASKLIGKTTTLQRSSTDAVGNSLDNEKLSEVGKDLMDTSDIRQMLRYTQGVAVINNAPPIRFGFPSDAKEKDTRMTEPKPFAVLDDLHSEPGFLYPVVPTFNNEVTGYPQIELPAGSLVVENPNSDYSVDRSGNSPENIGKPSASATSMLQSAPMAASAVVEADDEAVPAQTAASVPSGAVEKVGSDPASDASFAIEDYRRVVGRVTHQNESNEATTQAEVNSSPDQTNQEEDYIYN